MKQWHVGPLFLMVINTYVSASSPTENNEGGPWLRMDLTLPPSVPIRPRWSSSSFKKATILECHASGSPPPIIYWTKNGRRVSDEAPPVQMGDREGIASVKSRFVVPPYDCQPYGVVTNSVQVEKRTNKVVYTCVAETPFHTTASSTFVTYLGTKGCNQRQWRLYSPIQQPHPPVITLWNSVRVAPMGSDVTLPCVTGDPTAFPQWTDADGNKIIPGNNERITLLNDGSLHVRSLSWEDMGEYTCRVENSLGSVQQSVFLYPFTTENI